MSSSDDDGLGNDYGLGNDDLFFLGHEPGGVRGGPAEMFVENDGEMGYKIMQTDPDFDEFVKKAETSSANADKRDAEKVKAVQKSLKKSQRAKNVKAAAAAQAILDQAAKAAQAILDQAAAAKAIRDQAAAAKAIRDQAAAAQAAAAAVQAAHAVQAADVALSESGMQIEFQRFKLEADRVPNREEIRNVYSYYSQSPEIQLIINKFIANPSQFPPFGGDYQKAAEAAARWQQTQSGRRGGYKSKSKSKSKKYRYNKKSKTNKRHRTRSKSRSNRRSRK
jgi:hypothetical protein